jgi:circadian clock protein KaiC
LLWITHRLDELATTAVAAPAAHNRPVFIHRPDSGTIRSAREWVYELMAAVERTGARRVLIDNLADLRMAAPDETRFREFIYSLTQRFSRHGVSILMTMEVPDLFRLECLSESALSHLSDNVVLLKYVQDDHSILRAVSVIKSRANYHHPDIRSFQIGGDGIVLTGSLRPPDGR